MTISKRWTTGEELAADDLSTLGAIADRGGLGRITPQDYGAAADGSTNDATAIQNALNHSATYGVPFFLPAGVYIAKGLTIPASFTTWQGAGNDVAIIKRPASDGTNDSILLASNKTNFTIADTCFDGNKANNSSGSNNLTLSQSDDFRLLRVRSINAKASGGYGAGIILSQTDNPNVDGREIQVLGCESYDNDGLGLSIARTGAAIAIDGGTFSNNGGTGIEFYDQAITPASATVPNLAIRGARCESNTGSGISIQGFFVTGLSSTRTYGHGSDPVHGLVLAGNHCNDNGAYGIFCQATGATIASNVCRKNGSAGEAGICANAQDTVIEANIVEGGGIATGAYFGIDAGGLKWGSVARNQVWNVRGIGINLGAAQGVGCEGNTVRECGFAHINIALNDSGSKYFPWDAQDIAVTRNRISNTTSTSIFGVLVTGQPEHVDITDNKFEWPDALGTNAIRPGQASGAVRGNMIVNQGINSAGYTMNAAASIVYPDWADALNLNSDAAIITSILTSTQGAYVGAISAVKMTNRGSGYTADFAVSASGGGGSGFAATARVTQDGRVACVTIESQGTGYTSAPTLSFGAGSGTGAAATAYLGLNGLWGRELTLLAYGADFRLQTGTLITTPAPSGSAIKVRAGGMLRLRGVAGGWAAQAITDGSGVAYGQQVELSGGITWTTGSGSPEGVVTAPVGSFYSRTDGSTSTTLYVKTSGTGNTGWTAK